MKLKNSFPPFLPNGQFFSAAKASSTVNIKQISYCHEEIGSTEKYSGQPTGYCHHIKGKKTKYVQPYHKVRVLIVLDPYPHHQLDVIACIHYMLTQTLNIKNCS